MTLPTNTLTSHSAIGNREDLSDFIYDVTPTETPVLSMLPRVKGTSSKHEWQIKALAAASATNFNIEGDDATTDASNITTRLYNYRAISDKVVQVSGSQDTYNTAGRKSEMAMQMTDKMSEIKRDVEMSLLENNASVAGNTTLASECAGLQAFIATNINKAADATACAGNGTDAHTDGTPRALQESFVESVLGLCWDNGGNPTIGVSGKFQKAKFAGFAGSATTMREQASKKVINTVDVYIDPLGSEIRLVPCRQCPTDVVYFIDPTKLKFVTIRDFFSHDLAKTGDSTRKQILVEYTLEVCNQKAHGIVSDLTTS